MSSGNENMLTPSEASATESTDQMFWGHVTITANFTSSGYPPYMIAVLDNAGRFRPNLGVTKEQFETAQFAQQNRYSVLVSSDGGGPGTVKDIQAYS